MKTISKKQKAIKIKLIAVYKQIAEERDHYCTGCGRYDVPLSHSHYIPRSRRKDLETNINNITYHCLSIGETKGCHDLWDGNITDKKKLLDFDDAMEYIKKTDKEFYNLIN